jgi:hypothetical protein
VSRQQRCRAVAQHCIAEPVLLVLLEISVYLQRAVVLELVVVPSVHQLCVAELQLHLLLLALLTLVVLLLLLLLLLLPVAALAALVLCALLLLNALHAPFGLLLAPQQRPVQQHLS